MLAVYLSWGALLLAGRAQPLLAQEVHPVDHARFAATGDPPVPRRYVVQPGDTLLSVALEIGVDVEEMACLLAPDFTWDRPLVIGDVIEVPQELFRCHQVKPGETLASIAAGYGVAPESLDMAWNHLHGEPVPGTHLRVPMPDVQGETGSPAALSRPISADRTARPRYVVQPGDTLPTVAAAMGLDVADMPCLLAPDFTWDRPLVIGDVVEAPSELFWCHRVNAGETLAAIAARYGVAPDTLRIDWNRLDDGPTPGTYLRVPVPRAGAPSGGDGVAVASDTQAGEPAWMPEDWPYGSGRFRWPLSGWLTQGYHTGHRAVDLAAPTGTPVTAADRGVVVRAGWNEQGYGFFVVIDHRIDYITLYAHLSEIAVQEGQVIKPGQVIGKVGSTGNSTGPHLHFEIRDFGRRVDPLTLLPRAFPERPSPAVTAASR